MGIDLPLSVGERHERIRHSILQFKGVATYKGSIQEVKAKPVRDLPGERIDQASGDRSPQDRTDTGQHKRSDCNVELEQLAVCMP